MKFAYSLASAILLSVLGASASASATETAPAPAGPVMLTPARDIAAEMSFRLERFSEQLDTAATSSDFVGLAVAVVNHGEVELLRTYGVRDISSKAPVTPDTVFRIASLSKGFAASIAGLSTVDGVLSLDEPVIGYTPAFRLKNGAEKSVTLEKILSHRVGLPPNAYDNLLEDGVRLNTILPKFRSVTPICKVGTCYAYQNISFNMIADAIAHIHDAPYDEVVTNNVFTPLGMTNASFGLDGLLSSSDRASSYTRERTSEDGRQYTPWSEEVVKQAYYNVPAAGGVNASIKDMARWLAALMGGRPDVLPHEALEEIFTPRVATPAETRRWSMLGDRLQKSEYALGWRIYDYTGRTIINHSGSVEGYRAMIAFAPEEQVGIVVLANTRSRRFARLLPAFLDAAFDLDERDWLMLAEDEFARPYQPGQ